MGKSLLFLRLMCFFFTSAFLFSARSVDRKDQSCSRTPRTTSPPFSQHSSSAIVFCQSLFSRLFSLFSSPLRSGLFPRLSEDDNILFYIPQDLTISMVPDVPSFPPFCLFPVPFLFFPYTGLGERPCALPLTPLRELGSSKDLRTRSICSVKSFLSLSSTVFKSRLTRPISLFFFFPDPPTLLIPPFAIAPPMIP